MSDLSEGCVSCHLICYRFCNCIRRKVVVRGIYCTCDPMIGWHKHCMAKQVKANVETVCKKCKTTVHLDQGRVGTQQINRKGVNEDEEMEVGTQEVDKEAGRGGDEEEEREPTTEGDEDEEMGKGSSKEKEKSKRRGRRRINVASDSD